MLSTSIQCLGQCAYKNNSVKLTCLYDNFCKISAVPRKENELYSILETYMAPYNMPYGEIISQ